MGRPPLHVGCAFNGCDGAHAAKGYCETHYSRLKRRGTTAAVWKEWTAAEDELIKSAAKSDAQIAEGIGVTVHMVQGRRKTLGGGVRKCATDGCDETFKPGRRIRCRPCQAEWRRLASRRPDRRRYSRTWARSRPSSCSVCDLGGEHDFKHGRRGWEYHGCRCHTCETVARARRQEQQPAHRAYLKRNRKELNRLTRKNYHKKQSATSPSRGWSRWTSAEDVVAARTDITVLEIASVLGRSYASVKKRRRQLSAAALGHPIPL